MRSTPDSASAEHPHDPAPMISVTGANDFQVLVACTAGASTAVAHDPIPQASVVQEDPQSSHQSRAPQAMTAPAVEAPVPPALGCGIRTRMLHPLGRTESAPGRAAPTATGGDAFATAGGDGLVVLGARRALSPLRGGQLRRIAA